MKQFNEEINDIKTTFSKINDKKDSLNYYVLVKNKEQELLHSQKNIIKKAKGTCIRRVLQLMRMSKRLSGKGLDMDNYTVHSEKAKKFYRSHFWDYVKFTDSLLLRVPVLKNKLDEYFETIVTQKPDSIIADIDWLIEKAKGNQEVYFEILSILANKYMTPKRVEQDAVFVHLADKYLLTQELSSSFNENKFEFIQNIRNRMALNIIGAQAPPLTLRDSKGNNFSLYDLHGEFTIILFYDPDCEHCGEEVAKLQLSYEYLKENDTQVLGVCLSPDMEKWKKYIDDNEIEWINLADIERVSSFRHDYNVFGSPLLFLLDNDKRIIDKDVSSNAIIHSLKHIKREK